MMTKILTASPSTRLDEAVALLRNSQVVAIPTETVYGLAANALDPLGCSRIFQAKNRPTDNPLICHISSMEMLKMLVRKEPSTGAPMIPAKLTGVLERFWPGPLTVLLPKDESLSDIVTAGLDTVGVRFPSHPVALQLIRECNFPLAAPSANLSGRPSPTSAPHVLHDLDGRIPLIIDGGSSTVGLESTVLDATVEPPVILRPGAITAKMLRPFLPDIQVYGETTERNRALEERPPTPGMKYKHYSPTSPVILFKLGPNQEENIKAFVQEHRDTNLVRLCITEDQSTDAYQKIYLSKTGNPQEIARNLFAGLREADLLSPAYIIAQEIDEEEEGLAIMNRLSKAASEFI